MANKYYAVFSCGHRGYIYYKARTELYQKLAKAESSGLCPECRAKELMKTNVMVKMKYGEYISNYRGKRGIITGPYDKESKLIEVYLPSKLATEYIERKERVYYDAEIIGSDDNNIVIALFIKGNSFRIKDNLKELGYKWRNKRWQKELVVFPTTIDEDNKNKWLSSKDNPEFYKEIDLLKDLGCIDNLISLSL